MVDLLTLTLEEEKDTDRKLTEVTEQAIMPAAMGKAKTKTRSRRKTRSHPREKAASARHDGVISDVNISFHQSALFSR